MKNKLALGALAIAATLIGSGTALAEEGETPEQMEVELIEAIRARDILSGDSDMYEDLASPLHPAKPSVASKTPDQLQAELAEAIRTNSTRE
jgi:hypothetical protein